MADSTRHEFNDKLNIRYLGRLGQAYTFFCKFARVFIFQNDWITLPMAALIAGLVSLALGKEFGINKEGTLMGVFALVCVCLWNGTFNSIQIICRERDVVKREHRSGMYISSYILAHMVFQAIICLLQVVITLFTASIVGMKIVGEGLFTPVLAIDVAITLFLVTYAADMIALFISAVVRTTTIAMTIMPFVLIFQMVFSGGLFPLPDNIKVLKIATVSAPGFDALASQMNVNNLNLKSVDSMMETLDKAEMDVSISGQEIIDMLSDDSNESVRNLRSIKVGGNISAKEACELILNDDRFATLRKEMLINRITLGDALDEVAVSNDRKLQNIKNTNIEGATTVRDAMQYVLTDNELGYVRNSDVVEGVTLGELFSSIIAIGNDFPYVGNALDTSVEASVNVGDIIDFVRKDDSFKSLKDITLLDDTTVGEALNILVSSDNLSNKLDNDLSYYTNVGEVIDYLKNSPAGDEYKNTYITYHVKFKDMLDRMGKDKIIKMVEESAASDLFTGDYEYSRVNIVSDWLHLLILIILSSIAAIIALQFIDKDKR